MRNQILIFSLLSASVFLHACTVEEVDHYVVYPAAEAVIDAAVTPTRTVVVHERPVRTVVVRERRVVRPGRTVVVNNRPVVRPRRTVVVNNRRVVRPAGRTVIVNQHHQATHGSGPVIPPPDVVHGRRAKVTKKKRVTVKRHGSSGGPVVPGPNVVHGSR